MGTIHNVEKMTDTRFVNPVLCEGNKHTWEGLGLFCGIQSGKRGKDEAENQKKYAGRSDHLQYLRRKKKTR